MDEQEAVCVSRLGGADQRERLISQRSGQVGDRGKPGRMETEVQKLKAFKFKPESFLVSKHSKMSHLWYFISNSYRYSLSSCLCPGTT